MLKLFRIDGSVWSEGAMINVEEFFVHRETKCGYWISNYPHDHPYYQKERPTWVTWKWVSKTSRKRFAYPTIQEAIDSFRARKSRQRKILERQLDETIRLHKFLDRPETIKRLMKFKVADEGFISWRESL